jgi:hypothetical protein
VVLRRQGAGNASADPLPVSNRFAVLSEDDSAAITPAPTPVSSVEAESKESSGGKARRGKAGKGGILVIGSSNVRRIMAPLMSGARREGVSERVFSRCISGGTVPQVTDALKDEVTSTGCSRLRVVAHVGTNDASRRGSEEILRSFKGLYSEVCRVREVSGVDVGLTICSIVPRIDCGRLVWSRVEGLNQRLWAFCRDLGIDFVDLRPNLDSCWVPLDRSGVHYTTEAAQCVARRLLDHSKAFLD